MEFLNNVMLLLSSQFPSFLSPLSSAPAIATSLGLWGVAPLKRLMYIQGIRCLFKIPHGFYMVFYLLLEGIPKEVWCSIFEGFFIGDHSGQFFI